jgi:catechol 2,3-dioxygenase-like lactoylglutathione lyase family enzyme
MTIERMDHVGVVVEDMEAAKSFFVELGLTLKGEWTAEGAWVDRVIGLEGVRADCAMVETADGHSQLELVKFQTPASPDGDAHAPSNALGLRHVTFQVDDLDATLARMHAHGAELIGEVENYEDVYRVCYLRGPAGIIVELGERIG